MFSGKKQYKVEWAGCNPDTEKPWTPTWEDAQNIERSENDHILKVFQTAQLQKTEKVLSNRKKDNKLKKNAAFKQEMAKKEIDKSKIAKKEKIPEENHNNTEKGDENDDDIYDIHSIIDVRVTGDVKEFLIKW